MVKFWLGTHIVNWLDKTDVPLFVSWRTLHKRRTFPRALGEWVQDSGGFSELTLHGGYSVNAQQYAADTRRHIAEVGNMQWAAIQDWMCEPPVLNKTGLSLQEHQARTIRSYHELRDIAPEVNWVPVVQGWAPDDYFRHVDQYGASGVNLSSLPLVGIGSVCRRQNTTEAERVIWKLSRSGIRVHGFGFKIKGLERCGSVLTSSDSLAWALSARKDAYQRGSNFCGSTTHKNCANCLPWALHWREKLLNGKRHTEHQQSLFDYLEKQGNQ